MWLDQGQLAREQLDDGADDGAHPRLPALSVFVYGVVVVSMCDVSWTGLRSVPRRRAPGRVDQSMRKTARRQEARVFLGQTFDIP